MSRYNFSQNKIAKLLPALGLTLVAQPLFATEQPDASSLVGQSYIGAHGMYIKTDNDRLFTNDSNSSIDHGSGLGAEFGYRISEKHEARLSYTNINVNTDNQGYDVADGSSVAFDLLYFPYKKSLYFVAGADFLDIDNSNLSADLGAGYRYFINNNTAFYVEGKGHYQIDDNYTDFSTKIGFVYYFGRDAAPIKPIKTHSTPVKKVAKVVSQDSDKDGVIDSKDKCANTPITHKVDALGCTVYMKRQQTVELLVNFDNDKSDVKAHEMKEIAKVADFMKKYRQTTVTINGHTSAIGKAEYNQNLSERRAKAIVDILVNDFGVAANRLTAIGHGESQLKDPANTAQAHAINRRTEATITGAEKVPVTKR
ncbi:OmpA family protein [Thalassotalea sp. G2M2-11]|uniref:OmpA family protein n=1 Tax=Thalassotalea sp. G2M2-11 TaxID=2787627 RepID=UPI0019D07074|nr:OmpA family protein [Thalassotalea sp. G2M2-11]